MNKELLEKLPEELLKELDEVFENCEHMWRDLSNLSNNTVILLDIGYEKIKWMRLYNFKNIRGSCFFCDFSYKLQNLSIIDSNYGSCDICPGNLIGKNFSCVYYEYNYEEKPKEFYIKVKQLNKEYKEWRLKNDRGQKDTSDNNNLGENLNPARS